MSYEATLLVFGILLLLIGLVGKVKAKELEVGTSSTIARAVTGILGIGLIALSLSLADVPLLGERQTDGSQPVLIDSNLPTAEAERSIIADAILGTWDQYALINGRYERLGRFTVLKNGSEFVMAPVEQSRDPTIVNSIGIDSVAFDGINWVFVSEWSNGGRGEFRLQRISATEFQGAVWIEGVRSTENRWVKID